MAVKTTTTRTMSGSGTGPTGKELREFTQGLPDDAVIKFSGYAGDQRERTGPSWTMSATWEPSMNIHGNHITPGHPHPFGNQGYTVRGIDVAEGTGR